MSVLSNETRETVKKDVLRALAWVRDPVTARYLAKRVGRDKEFVMVLLEELLTVGKVTMFEENYFNGKKYVKWRKWR